MSIPAFLDLATGAWAEGSIYAGYDAALPEWDSVQRSETNAALFKQCVEAATEVGVFQNFVRDVIEK